MDSLQELVDTLARSLQRAVAVDDPNIHLIVHSSHFGDEDSVRLQSLLGRSIPQQLMTYVAEQGILTWHQPRYLEPNDGLGLSRRLCFPLWSRDQLLGFMWIIDADGSLSQSERAMADETADRVLKLLSQRSDLIGEEEREQETLLLGLIAGDEKTRAQAARGLRDLGVLAVSDYYTAFSIAALNDESIPATRDVIAVLRRAVTKAMVTRLRESYAFAETNAGAVLVVATKTALTAEVVTGVAGQIQREVKALGHGAGDPVVGVGNSVSELSHINVSHDQAETAVRCALACSETIGVWSRQSALALLSAAAPNRVLSHLVPGALEALKSQSQETLRLIELFLETAGSATQTAGLLHMHRTTVYYRIGHFQKTSGISLDDGETRFLFQLWFKLRKLGLLEDATLREATGPSGTG